MNLEILQNKKANVVLGKMLSLGILTSEACKIKKII